MLLLKLFTTLNREVCSYAKLMCESIKEKKYPAKYD